MAGKPFNRGESLKKQIENIASEIIALRRQLHRAPELGFNEVRTGEIIAGCLEKLGVSVQTGVAKTGVVGLLRGQTTGKTLLIRADMDALPIQERSQHDYASQNPGVMHACGHDVHMAMALGVAKVLSANKHALKGNVKFVFQPAEEAIGGALPMIEQGVMENPKVDGAVALHVWDLPLGTVGVKTGSVTAATDFFDITITGKGGHGAKPELCINPITAAAQLVGKINQIEAPQCFVATVCSIKGGEGDNTVPDTCRVKGTVRTLDMETRQLVHERITGLAKAAADEIGAAASIDYRFLYPPTVNHEGMTQMFEQSARQVLGLDSVIFQEKVDMTGEDFAYFAQLVPACYIRLGGAGAPLHTDKFDVDEACIPLGIELVCDFVLRFFNQE